MLEPYFPILLFIIVGVGLGSAAGRGRFMSPNRPDAEKPLRTSAASRLRGRAHEVRRALLPIAILFILFDLEIAFLFPWAVVLPDIGGSVSGR